MYSAYNVIFLLHIKDTDIRVEEHFRQQTGDTLSLQPQQGYRRSSYNEVGPVFFPIMINTLPSYDNVDCGLLTVIRALLSVQPLRGGNNQYHNCDEDTAHGLEAW